ncbi:MAG: hypothetical protein KatS3mg108_0144 [Isosphaeraceae bacterium]|jgi:hypothetical protein|nr:MAG: hypothetical protein KatS3mg108_0144 [Isosphaeraceae bacterium]
MEELAQAMAAKLSSLMGSWKSIEIECETTMRFKAPAGGIPGLVDNTMRVRYVETAEGQRFHEASFHLANGQRTSGGRAYCDGQRCASVMYRDENSIHQDSISISLSFNGESSTLTSQRPLPLRFLYVGLEPLPEALRERAEHVGPSNALGRPCETFLIRDVRLSIGTVLVRPSLDRETAVPLAIDWFKNESTLAAGRPFRTWRATKFEVRDGVPVVTQSRELLYQDGTDNPSDTYDTRVTKLNFNKEYPASTFWPVPQPGVMIFDRIKGTCEMVPGDPVPSTASPIRADGVPAWDPAQAAMLGLGLALVAVAGALWWRNR